MYLKTYVHEWNKPVKHKSAYINCRFGFVKLYIDNEIAILHDLIVYPEYRGKGYGKKLIDEAVAQSIKHKVKKVKLYMDGEDWLDDLYSKSGFIKKNNSNEYYKNLFV